MQSKKIKLMLLFIAFMASIVFLKFEVVVPGDGVITGRIGDVDIVTPDSGFIDLLNVKEGDSIEKENILFSYNNLETHYREGSLSNLISLLKRKRANTQKDKDNLEKIYAISEQNFNQDIDIQAKALETNTARYLREFSSISQKLTNMNQSKKLSLNEKAEIQKERRILFDKIKLLKKSNSPKVEILDSQKEISKLDASIIRIESEILSTETEVKKTIDNFQISLLEKINLLSEELEKIERELLESNDSLALTLSKKKANVITSPVTGTVMSIEQNFTVGSYIEASQKVMTIKQTQSNSLIKAKILAKYRPFINTGDSAKISVNSSGYKSVLQGEIIYISVDSLKNEDNPAIAERFYEVEIIPDAAETLTSEMIGVQVNIFVITDKISILDYITATIVDNIRFNAW